MAKLQTRGFHHITLVASSAHRTLAFYHERPTAPTITADMETTGLHHVSGMTDDIERASDLQQEALGLTLMKKTISLDDPDTPHWFWANHDGARVLPGSGWTLFGWSPRHQTARGGIGQSHDVAFCAKDGEEQLVWREHLLGMGLEVSPETKAEG